MLAKPDDWAIRVSDLRKHGDIGRDGVYSVLNELQRYGYLVRTERRDQRRRIAGTDYTLFEVPLPGFPDTDEPDQAAPITVEPPLPNNHHYQERVVRRTTTTTAAAIFEADENGDNDCQLIFPDSIVGSDIGEALRSLRGLTVSVAQQILDELEGRLRGGTVRGSPLAYLHGLARRARAGRFTPKVGVPATRARESHRQCQSIYGSAQSEAPHLKEVDPDGSTPRPESYPARRDGSGQSDLTDQNGREPDE